MARLYSQLKSLVNSKLQKAAGTITDSDFLANMNMALDAFRMEVDLPQAIKTQTLSPALFKDVILYSPPSDLSEDGIVDVRPVIDIPNSNYRNSWQKSTSVSFEENLLGDRSSQKWTIEYNNGAKTLRLLTDNSQSPQAQSTALNTCDTYNGNGTWTADTSNSDANTVASNLVNYFEGSGSTSFNVTVSQSSNNYATIYNPSINPVNVSSFNTPYLFFYVYFPSAVTYISSITFYVGSDTSATPSTKANYYTFTATTQFGGSAFVQGKNLIGLPLSGATSTGSPSLSALAYLECKISYSASQTNMTGVLLDAIYWRDGLFHEIRYFTTNVVVATGGTAKQYFTADDDYTLMEPDGEMAFTEYAAGYIAPNVKDVSTGELFWKRAQRAIEQFKGRHPSERRRNMKNWYYAGSDYS